MVHWIGLTVGACAVAVATALLAGALSAGDAAIAVAGTALGVLAVIAGSLTLAGWPARIPSSPLQVPMRWRYAFRPRTYMFLYGAGLGTGVLTQVRSYSFYVFVGLVFLAADVRFALVAAAAYALGRAVPVLAAAVGAPSAESFDAGCDRRLPAVHRLDALVLLGVGLAASLTFGGIL